MALLFRKQCPKKSSIFKLSKCFSELLLLLSEAFEGVLTGSLDIFFPTSCPSLQKKRPSPRQPEQRGCRRAKVQVKGIYGGYIGIMEKRMETIGIIGVI